MPRDIVFVIARGKELVGSAEMRGRQLCGMVAEAAGGTRRVRMAFHDEPVRSAIVVVNKTALRPPFLAALHGLHAEGCFVLADFIDMPVLPEIADQVDGFLACSVLQARHLAEHWPAKPVIHLPHHADPAIGRLPCRWDRFSAGYFGMAESVAHLDAVVNSGLVQAWRTTVGSREQWIRALAGVNLHYACRPRRMWGRGFKPFTKGAVAARAGAVVLVDASDHEAMEQLGSDYPLTVPAEAEAATIIARLAALRDTFGGPEWREARERMRPLREAASQQGQRALIQSRLLAHPALQ
jgi:hypothetical protein